MIYPPDLSKAAKKDRRSNERPEPDFEADALLVEPGLGNEEVKVRVMAEVVAQGDAELGAVFHLRVKPGYKPFPLAAAESGYEIDLSRLQGSGWCNEVDDDWGVFSGSPPLFLPSDTREAMLVWWDAHAGEVEARISENPGAEEVEYHLARVNLPFSRERSGGADWSVDAWSLGDDIYLADNEDGGNFSLIRRDMVGEDDEIEELADGTLAEMLEAAPDFLKGGKPTRHSWPKRNR